MPIYDTSNNYKLQSATEYFKNLVEKKAVIKIEKVAQKRTIDQNALYWLWLTCIEKETGNNKNEFHLLYRANFLAKEDSYITKIIIPSLWERTKIRINAFDYFKGLEDIISIISFSTTDQDTAQMTTYLDKIKDHANNSMGILLLNMQDKLFVEFYNEYK